MSNPHIFQCPNCKRINMFGHPLMKGYRVLCYHCHNLFVIEPDEPVQLKLPFDEVSE